MDVGKYLSGHRSIQNAVFCCFCSLLSACSSPNDQVQMVEKQGIATAESTIIASRISLARQEAVTLFETGKIAYHDIAVYTYMIVRNDPFASAYERETARKSAHLIKVPVDVIKSVRPSPQDRKNISQKKQIPNGLRLK